MTKIVIIGAGFAGVTAALGLDRKLRGKAEITLIDRRDYFLFTPNLYEVATAEEEFTTVKNLKKSIAVPLSEIFHKTRVKVVTGEASYIETKEKKVRAGMASVPYDYIVLASGSVPEYYGIKGAMEFAMPIKTFRDALAIRNRLEFIFQARQIAMQKHPIRLVVAGGGYAGCELVSELAKFVQILCWKYEYQVEKVETVVAEAEKMVIPDQKKAFSEAVWERLKELGVRVILSSPIAAVSEHFVEFGNGEKEEYDALIWSTGTRGAEIKADVAFPINRCARIDVNSYLQVKGLENIFAIGDIGGLTGEDGKLAAPTFYNALDQGEYIAYALPKIIQNIRPKSYCEQSHPVAVTLGGRSAAFIYKSFYVNGFSGYFIRSYLIFASYRKLVGFWKALKYILWQWEEYHRND